MTPKETNRAERFLIRVPVFYREPHTSNWFEGRTVNISNSGVLFRGQLVLAPKTAVEIRIKLPPPLRNESHAEIVCKGAVVRIEPGHENHLPALGVAIQHYRLTRKSPIQ